ncbi:MAG TPA: 2-C-methyl-D-erythritol 4-phosphate cytidylyltransferase [Frankiaceae bacterium]|nr:2-C-methyl-D-erythritol 4-phosphate cytidylyltransferase [Frankiaceae bacterium]
MTVAVVVPAAGRGERLGAGGPKALRLIAGRTLLQHAVDRLHRARTVDLVVVAVPPGEQDRLAAELGVRTVAGGADRQASVAAALAALPVDVHVVLVHDAARPFAPPSLVDAVAEAVLAGAPAVVPGLPVVDTIKRVDLAGRVLETPRRDTLRAIQTPQGFRRDVLEAAHRHDRGAHPATDDAGLVELLGEPVLVIPGHEDAFKVTRPADLGRAEALLAAAAPLAAKPRARR